MSLTGSLPTGLAAEQRNGGEHARAALLVRTAAGEVGCGFALSRKMAGHTIDEALTKARSMAERLETAEPPGEPEVRAAMQGLRDVVTGLAEALGSRPALRGDGFSDKGVPVIRTSPSERRATPRVRPLFACPGRAGRGR